MWWRAVSIAWLAAGIIVSLGLGATPACRAAVDPAGPTAEVEALGGDVGPLATGPDGALWFAAGKMLGRIGPDGGLTELPLSEPVGFLGAVVMGREGDLWGTSGEEVLRISAGGAVSRFRLPRPGERAGQIAVARNGMLWFTVWAARYRRESSFGKAFVIRLSPAGRMRRFPLPGSARRRDEPPGSIVAGPGGDIWFTDPAFDRVGRITPGGRLTEFSSRLQPETLASDGADGLWFVGLGGIGMIDATGSVRELRTGKYFGLEIGSADDAVVGPDGNLWFIGGATRLMRLTPSGHLSVVRGPGAPAASHIALGPGGSIWLSTVSNPIKGVLDAPLLRYEPGVPGVEVRPGTAVLRDGRVRVRLACGGSASDCSGKVSISFGRGGRISKAYDLAASSGGGVSLMLPARERHLLARRGFARVATFASADGGYDGFTELVIRSQDPPAPRLGRPLVIPLPEGIEVDGLVRGRDGTLWTGGDIGRFNRVAPDGRVSTVAVAGLGSRPSPIGLDSRRGLWFLEYAHGFSYEFEPTLSRLAPDGKLRRVRLPAGPSVQEGAVARDGTVWVVRSDYPDRGEVEEVDANGKIRSFQVGVEPGAIVAGGDGGAWFAESGPRIVHIGASGGMRFFRLPNKGFIMGMALGRRGDIWFTHWSGHGKPPAIGRITRAGRVSERPIRHLGVPGEILVAPDGNVWFTTDFPRRVVRMTPEGDIRAWRRGAAAAGTIALGPEGSIWLAAADANTVAAFHP